MCLLYTRMRMEEGTKHARHDIIQKIKIKLIKRERERVLCIHNSIWRDIHSNRQTCKIMHSSNAFEHRQTDIS